MADDPWVAFRGRPHESDARNLLSLRLARFSLGREVTAGACGAVEKLARHSRGGGNDESHPHLHPEHFLNSPLRFRLAGASSDEDFMGISCRVERAASA